jgi:hypothetical protein
VLDRSAGPESAQTLTDMHLLSRRQRLTGAFCLPLQITAAHGNGAVGVHECEETAFDLIWIKAGDEAQGRL